MSAACLWPWIFWKSHMNRRFRWWSQRNVFDMCNFHSVIIESKFPVFKVTAVRNVDVGDDHSHKALFVSQTLTYTSGYSFCSSSRLIFSSQKVCVPKSPMFFEPWRSILSDSQALSNCQTHLEASYPLLWTQLLDSWERIILPRERVVVY